MTEPARAAEDSARALREKKRVLAALVVHDLRSPLSAVQGYLGLLREELGDQTVSVNRYLEDALEFIKQADTHLFAAKEGGRNQVKG